MTLEQFQVRINEIVPKEHGLFVEYIELVISLDGCMMVKFGNEYIPHLADCDWSKVLDGAVEWLKNKFETAPVA
jgi:hypothetical protein